MNHMEKTEKNLTVCCFSNNKLWITRDLKVLLNKEESFRSRDRDKQRQVQRELREKLLQKIIIIKRYVPMSRASPAAPCSKRMPMELFCQIKELCAPFGKKGTTFTRWLWESQMT